jgi:hypothetical protein
MRQRNLSIILSAIFSALTLHAFSQSTLGVGDVFPGKVEYAAFTLASDQNLDVHVTGGAFHEEDWKLIVYYGWIIDSETRKTVWHTSDKMDDHEFEYGDFEVRDKVNLKKGTYEVYFTGAFHQRENWGFDNFTGFVEQVFSDRRRVKYNSEMREGMGITVTGNLTKTSAAGLIDARVKDAVVSIIKPDHNANVKKGFSLSAETTLRIYAVGEGRKDETFDYAWIYDIDKRKRVWVMDYSNSDFAGGAKKNLRTDEKITLPAGNYLVSFVTDDSHTYNDWNSMPPEDPQFTGITIWAEKRSNVIPFKMPEEVKPVLQLTQVRDDEYVSKGLTVTAATQFRVLCIGEESDDEMADNGWIMNAATKEVVWDMNERRREHAGGAEKNKMVDETLTLEKGDYIVHYATDDSHSFGDWNSGPPHEQDYYGISLWVTKKEDLSKVKVFNANEYKNDKVVVEIVRVRDDEQLSETFTLDRDTKLRIVAIGEGDDDELVDYGWIKNTETGKVVWEMTYRNTESAGGASKNRLFNDTIILPKGTYKVYYETDGSHSYRSWNATPPRDQERYGISLLKENL